MLLACFKRFFDSEYRFRLIWHGVLLAMALLGSWLAPHWVRWPVVIACAYYLITRLASDWERRGEASGIEVSVRAIAWILAGHELHHRRILVERYGVGTA